jgi:predicted flap endonuclease-1-like 5' DNA nuclease
MATLVDVEGIGETYAKKLKDAGVATQEALLEKAGSAKGREELAAASGISEKLILEWVNHVDLMRIKGVGSEYSDLLEEAGVDSCPELAHRRADNLHAKLVEINEQKKLVRALPTQEQVEDWIEQAKKLPKVVTH